MNKKQVENYVNLVKILLTCPDGQEGEILQQNIELVDAVLLDVMQQISQDLNEQGNENAALWLIDLAEQLAEELAIGTVEILGEPENTEEFLLAALQIVAGNQDNPQQIYTFLEENQENLDEELLYALPEVVDRLLLRDVKSPTEVAAIVSNFGAWVQQFTLGKRWLNLEISIASYQLALKIYTHEAFPRQWAMTQNNLATAYLYRIQGERANNLELAISIYHLVLQIYTRESFPMQWADTQNNLATAYLYRIQGERANNLELAISIYHLVLQIYTRESFPQQWAMIQNNLAIAYRDRIEGERADNIEQAIVAYQLALEIYTREAFPAQWAGTLSNLGESYRIRIYGEQADNIEQAIVAYQLALEIYTREAFPEQWAGTLSNLATAYSNFIQRESNDNIETAIIAYQQVLEVYTSEAFPEQWARTQNQLAVAYSYRTCGDRSDNIEQAIVACQLSLQIYTRESFPEQWASTHSNLATAYLYRICGERSNNIEQAITAYQCVLQVYTRKAFPERWAIIQNNLGEAYRIRIYGERADNIEQAIISCKLALQVITRTSFPEQWAMTQHNLALAYSDDIRNERANNLEQAIAAYQLVLQIYTREAFPERWAITLNNLGDTYRTRIYGEQADNFEQAIAAYQLVLQIYTCEAFPEQWAMAQNNLALVYSERIIGEQADNLEQAITKYQLALEVYTHKAFPEQWAMVQNNLAFVYSKRILGESSDNIKQSITKYSCALEIYTPQSFPKECCLTAQNLGELYFKQQDWTEAAQSYVLALQASEILYQSAFLLEGKASELSEIDNLPLHAAYSLARSGNLQAAALTLEQYQARGLSETLNRDLTNLSQLRQTHPHLYTQYQDITTQLHNLETQQRFWITSGDYDGITPKFIRTEALRLRQNLTEAIAKIRQNSTYEDFMAQPSYEDICQAIQPGVALVYLLSTTIGSLALIITPDRIVDLWLDDLTENNLQKLISTWFDTYARSQINQKTWLDEIDDTTNQLWQPLMAPLIDHLQQHNLLQASLIPTGCLSFLPLHAVWTEDPATATGRKYALDDIHLTHIPNARSLKAALAIAQRTASDSILAIDNPLQDLPNSGGEVSAAIATFSHHKVLQYDAASIESVLVELPHYNVLHFSCHGAANFRQPLNSGLAMSDGILTLRDILDLRLSEQGGIRLAVLSACETGLTAVELANQAIGLTSGLLQAGVAGMVASLWSVSDLSTMMLLVRFYDYWRNDSLEPSTALRYSQQWIRDTTNREKISYFKSLITDRSVSKIPASTADYLYKSLILSRPEARDFAHPFQWSAFRYVGV